MGKNGGEKSKPQKKYFQVQIFHIQNDVKQQLGTVMFIINKINLKKPP